MATSVLVYGSRKCDPVVFPDSDAGFLALFKLLDESQDSYFSLKDESQEKELKEAVESAVKAEELLQTVTGPLKESLQAVANERSKAEDSLSEYQEQKALYQKAKEGNAAAARKLLYARIDYEYEDFSKGTLAPGMVITPG